MAAPPSYNDAVVYPNTAGGAVPYPPQGAPYPTEKAPFSAPGAPYNATDAHYPPPTAAAAPMIGFMPPSADGGRGGPPMMPPPVRMIGAIPQDMYEPKDDDETGLTSGAGFAGRSLSDKAIRRAFIRKVYAILSAQLLVTVAFVAFFLFHKPSRDWVQGPGFWCYYVSYAVFLVTYITLVCCPTVRRSYPGNFICLSIFTLAFSYMTGMIASFYETGAVLVAAAITTLVCVSITLFAIQTKIDFTMCTGLLFCLCMVVFFFGLSCFFVYMIFGFNYIMHCVYGALAALLFSLFLAYDTQMLLGGRKYQLSEEEHVFAALQLYLDVVYLFLIILSLFGGNKN